MNSKSLLIAIAALALTATGAQAFTENTLVTAGLSEEQQLAFETARELRKEGDSTAARDVLLAAGVDELALQKVREALRNEKEVRQQKIDTAIANFDFSSFKDAIKGLPLNDVVLTEEDFKAFVEAHNFAQRDSRNVVLTAQSQTLGTLRRHYGGLQIGVSEYRTRLHELSDAEQAAFRVAQSANNREVMKAILYLGNAG